MSKLLIGWAEESIVPEKKVSLQGQFYERISNYVESEISVTAMAVEADGDQLVLVSADLVSITADLMKLFRQKLAELTDGIDPMKLVVCATHTHTSHTLKAPAGAKPGWTTIKILEEFLPEGKRYQSIAVPDETVMRPEEAALFVADKIALAAKRAWDNRAPALIANEFGRAAVGMCRRVSYDDGSAQMWGDVNTANFVALEGGNDSGVELLYTFDMDKNITGVVANIACPAQILEQRSFISADYWGRAKANLRKTLGDHIYLLGLGGAGGDQCPRDLIRWVNPETPINDPNVKRPNYIQRKADPSMFDISGCNRAGKRVSNEILSVLEEVTDYQDEAVFVHKVLQLDLPLRKVTMAEYNHAVRELEYYVAKNSHKESFNFEDNARMHVYAGTIKRFREQQLTEVYPIEYHVIRLGNIAIATNPFELFLDYGNRIKARSYAQQTLIVQLCCSSGGYLPTAKAEAGGHYSAYVSSGFVGSQGGDILTRNTIHEINELWKEAPEKGED